jgi:GAF domain-containing protein
MPEPVSPALKAVSDAVLAVASRRSVDEVLQQLVDCARELVEARYAALGIPDGAGGFRRFLVAGMSDELVAAMGPLPRTHGMLGAMLETDGAYLTDDIHSDPRFRGWWPRAHPDMRSFLGVPIVAPGEGVIGAFYLTEKRTAPTFDAHDRELIELLASHAARRNSASAAMPPPATSSSRRGAPPAPAAAASRPAKGAAMLKPTP